MKNIAALEAAEAWDVLAEEQLRMAEYEEGRGYLGDVQRNRAALYKRAAQSLRLEAETGVFHCVTCLKPGLHAHKDR